MWLAAAAAYGAPTRTGTFGETIGNVAGALGPEFEKRSQFERGKEAEAMQLQEGIGGIDRDLLGQRLQMLKWEQEQQGKSQEAYAKFAERRAKDAERNLKTESGMRKEFNTLLKDYEKVADAYGRVKAASAEPSAAGDLALIFNYMKMLDPGSTVREGEFATAQNSAGVPGRIVSYYNNILRGERLNPPQRADFLRQAEGLYATAREGAEIKADSYRDLAINAEVDPDNVITVWERAKDRFDQAGGSAGQTIIVNMPDGGKFEVSKKLVDKGNKTEILRLYEESKGGGEFAKGGPVFRRFGMGATEKGTKLRALIGEFLETFYDDASDPRVAQQMEELQPGIVGETIEAFEADDLDSLGKRLRDIDEVEFYSQEDRMMGGRPLQYDLSGEMSGKDFDIERLKKEGMAKGGRVFQNGGEVDFGDIAEEEAEEIDFEGLGEDSSDTMQDLLIATGATAGGAGAGLGLEEVGTRLEEMRSGFERPSRPEQILGSAMESSSIDPEEAVVEMKRGRRMGVPETLMETAGPVAREVSKRALMSSGEVGNVALEALSENLEGSRERVGRRVEKSLRTPEYFTTEMKMTDKLYENAAPLYKAAFAENAAMKHPPFYKEMFESKYGKKAIENAFEFIRESGKKIGKENIAGWVEKPSLEFLDQIKRGYDQQIMAEIRKSGSTPKARILKGQRSRLVDWMDKNSSPAYKQARAQYKGDMEVLEALEFGRKDFIRTPPEELKGLYDGMSFSEKQAARTGVAQKLYEIIYAPSGDTAAARRIIGSPDMQRRMELLFDKPREYRVFKAALDREMNLWEKGRKTVRAAESGRTRRGAQEALELDNPESNIKNAIAGGPTAWVLRTLGWGRGKGLSEKQADEIVRIMTTGDVKELEEIAPRLKRGAKYAKKRKGRRGKAGLVGTAVGAALGAAHLLGDDEEDEDG